VSEIIVDSREPSYIKALATRVETMPVDILIVGEYRKYVVERKTTSDYWHSVVDGRLWRQMREMERLRDEEGYIPIVLIVGRWDKLMKQHGITLPQYLGMQVALSTFGVTPVWVTNKDACVFAIKYLAAKAGQARSYARVTIPKPMTRTLEEERTDVLCAIRGVGPVTAEKLLQNGNSLRQIFNMGLEELSEIVGEKVARHILEVVAGDGGS
jgi:ERCC4-type nuclease